MKLYISEIWRKLTHSSLHESDRLAIFSVLALTRIVEEELQRVATEDSFQLHSTISSLSTRLPEDISDLFNRALVTCDPRFCSLRFLQPVIERLNHLPPDLRSSIASQIFDLPFGSIEFREDLLKQVDAVTKRQKSLGEFRLAADVADLMAALARIGPNDRIFIPTVSAGELVIAASRRILASSPDGSIPASLQISGWENNLGALSLATLRVFLSGSKGFQLMPLSRDSYDNGSAGGEFDVVLANPHWSSRHAKPGRGALGFWSDPIGLDIQFAISGLSAGGRATILLPEGYLSRRGREAELRRHLLERYRVEDVVHLPTGSLGSAFRVSTAVILLVNDVPTKRVRFINAGTSMRREREGRSSAAVPADDLRAIRAIAQRAGPSEYSWDVEISSLAEVHWDLTPRPRREDTLGQVLTRLREVVEVVRLDECATMLGGRSVKSKDLVGPMEVIASLDHMTDARSPAGTPVPIQPQEESVNSAGLTAKKKSHINALRTHARTPEVAERPSRPFIRIRDIVAGEVTPGTSHVPKHIAQTIPTKLFLRRGDVLVSKSGTIGKVGIVNDSGIGGVPSSGFFLIRTNEYLDPSFLKVYLSTPECRAWCASHSTGAAVSHLSSSGLGALPVPLPNLEIQKEIAALTLKESEHALQKIEQLLLNRRDNPLDRIIDESWTKLQAYWTEPSPQLNPFIEKFLVSLVTDYRDSLAGKRLKARNDQWEGWLQHFQSALESIADAKVSSPSTAMSLQQESRWALVKATELIPSNAAKASKAREVTKFLARWVDDAIHSDAVDARLEVSVIELREAGSVGSVLEVAVRNIGAAPIRDFSFRELSLGIEATSKVLEPSSDCNFTFELRRAIDPSDAAIALDWSGEAIDGTPIGGTYELSIDLSARANSNPAKKEIGYSPYICGDPVGPQHPGLFFGRDQLIDQIQRQVVEAGNVILLEGNRRSGKTSILSQLEGRKRVPGWLAVSCSLQAANGSKGGVGVETADIFREMAASIARATHREFGTALIPGGHEQNSKWGIARACEAGISQASPFGDFREYLEFVLERLASSALGLLLMFDEFDKLQEGIDRGITSPQIPENIRFLVQTFPKFSAIITGSRRLRRLREEYWSVLYGLGTRFGVSSLDEGSARRLVTEPVAGRLTYAQDALDEVIRLTACQPYLLQCLSSRIFDQAAQSSSTIITKPRVEEAAMILVAENEHFASLWGYAETNRRRVVLALCHSLVRDEHGVSFQEMLTELQDKGLMIGEESLVKDLEFLRELELIHFCTHDERGLYRLEIPLMGIWISKERDLATVLSEALADAEDEGNEP